MLKLTPCANAPLFKSGIAVESLYFTKAPGDQYLSVYAQYKNDSEWVPLHIGLRAVPTLQQVRDEDRNIAVDSGSYEDAHLYLRSAAGNNMTAAYYTNAEGAAIQVGNIDDYQSLHLQPEGGLLTYNGEEVATQDWVKAAALVRKSDPVTDFNVMLTAGIYEVSSGLNAIPNYPNIGNNNNNASAGMLVVYKTQSVIVQYFYPYNEISNQNRSTGYWFRRSISSAWEYKNGILEISNKNAATTVHADNLVLSGDYLITGNLSQLINSGFPDSGATVGGIPLMLTVRKAWGVAPWTTHTTQEVVSMQESPLNRTRKWIRTKFNWQGENAHAWDAWNEVGLLRDVYTKDQLGTSGAGHVHWDNIDNKPPIVNTETDPTVPAHVKNITTTNISSWNAKEDAANKSSNIALGTSNTLYPTQNAVKAYVDNAINTNNGSFVRVTEKGAANGVATLGANGKIPNNQIPALAITETFPVNSEAEMLALTADTGDVAVRNDLSKSFILKNTPASTLSNWIELKSPTVANTDQVPEGTQNLYFTNARARNALSPVAPVTYNATTGAIGITQAGTASNGYLSATDWNTFSSKQNALGFTPENTAHKATNLNAADNTSYPTTLAVSNAINAAAANLQQTTDRGNTTTNPLIVTGTEGREVKTYLPSPTSVNTIISGTSFKWYNDLVTVGAIRTGTSTVEGFGVDINGDRRLTLDIGGNLTTPGRGDFNEVLAHSAVSALGTPLYTSGAKFVAIWNGSTGRFEYTDEVFLKTETDPVYTSQEPYLVKTRKNYYGNGNGFTLATAGLESGFTYSDGSDGANISGPFISVGQLNYANGYLLQLTGAYGSSDFKIRTRNGDIGVWNPWRRIYTDADPVLTAVPSLNDVSNVDNTISKSGATFNNPHVRMSKPDGTQMSASLWTDETGFNIQSGNSTGYRNTILNPLSGKVGIGINPDGTSDKLAISGSVFVSTGNGSAINFEGGSHIDRYNSNNLNIVTNGLYWNSNLVATQSWINTNTIQNQIGIAQNANSWISGESRAGSLKAVASNREIRTYFSSATPVSTLVAATEFAWYNDKVSIGAVRGGSTDIEALGVEFNGTRALTIYPDGSVNSPGNGRFAYLTAQNYLTAYNTPQYTSGTKLTSIWNGTTGRYEYALDQDTNFTMKAAGGEVNSVTVKDTRNDNPAPNARNGGMWWDFKSAAAVGLPAGGLYAGVLTLSPYHDNSGLDNGTNVSQIASYQGKLLHRSGAGVSTWDAWQTIASWEDIISSGMFLLNQFNSAQPANAWISGDLRLSGMANGFGNMVMIDANGTLRQRTFSQFATDASASIIQNQFAGAQGGNIWINGSIRANRFDLANGQNLTWGGGYNPGIPTISAATGTGITFYPDGSNGPNGGLQVSFPATGSIKVAQLATGATAMVVADANGLLHTQAIPGTTDQWQDIQSYNYLSPDSPGHGAGRGIDTYGGFAARGRKITATDYVVAADDYILLFTGKVEVALPDPNVYPGRILKLRSAPSNMITFKDFMIEDFGTQISTLAGGRSAEIQSIEGAWCLVMAAN